MNARVSRLAHSKRMISSSILAKTAISRDVPTFFWPLACPSYNRIRSFTERHVRSFSFIDFFVSASEGRFGFSRAKRRSLHSLPADPRGEEGREGRTRKRDGSQGDQTHTLILTQSDPSRGFFSFYNAHRLSSPPHFFRNPSSLLQLQLLFRRLWSTETYDTTLTKARAEKKEEKRKKIERERERTRNFRFSASAVHCLILFIE